MISFIENVGSLLKLGGEITDYQEKNKMNGVLGNLYIAHIG